MSRITPRATAIVLAAAMLAACGGGTAESANNDAVAEAAANNVAVPDALASNEAVPATEAAMPADGVPTADYMVGKWSATAEDCADTLEFRKDGTAATPIGEAKWTLAGNKLAVDFGDGGKQDPTTVTVLSQDRIEITMKSGRKETQKRC